LDDLSHGLHTSLIVLHTGDEKNHVVLMSNDVWSKVETPERAGDNHYRRQGVKDLLGGARWKLHCVVELSVVDVAPNTGQDSPHVRERLHSQVNGRDQDVNLVRGGRFIALFDGLIPLMVIVSGWGSSCRTGLSSAMLPPALLPGINAARAAIPMTA
jgi:hypothetical protein